MAVKQVLVTGGARRLGELICRKFAAAGWHVWCHYNRSPDAARVLCEELEKMGGRATPIQADLADESQRRSMVQRITTNSGPITCLVNNASCFEPDQGDALNVDAMRHQLEINLVAPLSLGGIIAREIPTEGMADDRSIIHILDQKVFNLNPDYFSYTISKLALERAVQLQAQALAPALRVCGIAPGLMYLSGPQTQRNFEQASRVNLLRRPTDPQQVASACLFLAENPCVTGSTLCIDNGQHLVPLPRDVMFVVEDLMKGAHDV